MRELLEKEIEAVCCSFFTRVGLFFWKTTATGFFDTAKKRFRKQSSPYVMNGVPDVIVVHGGRFYGVEFKTTKGKQSEAQKEFERRLRLPGVDGHYFICRTVEDAQSIYQAIKAL